MSAASVTREHFKHALAALVEKLQADRNVLAAVLMGSLAHDVVWEKSDIDLLVVTLDEKNERSSVALVELDVNIHASLVTRSEFRKLVEGSLGSSIMHSTLSKSRLLFARDETLGKLWENLRSLGSRDRQIAVLRSATRLTYCLYKARKFCEVRGDPHGAYLWLTHAFPLLAQIEVNLSGQIADREVLDQALRLAPEFFGKIYLELMDQPKTTARVQAALDEIDAWLVERIPELFQPILDYLAEAADVRSVTEIDGWFHKQFHLHGVSGACEWLADRGVITKLSAPLRLTRRSQVQLEEMAFYHESK
jgi:predicted nucleotidyltransferase